MKVPVFLALVALCNSSSTTTEKNSTLAKRSLIASWFSSNPFFLSHFSDNRPVVRHYYSSHGYHHNNRNYYYDNFESENGDSGGYYNHNDYDNDNYYHHGEGGEGVKYHHVYPSQVEASDYDDEQPQQPFDNHPHHEPTTIEDDHNNHPQTVQPVETIFNKLPLFETAKPFRIIHNTLITTGGHSVANTKPPTSSATAEHVETVFNKLPLFEILQPFRPANLGNDHIETVVNHPSLSVTHQPSQPSTNEDTSGKNGQAETVFNKLPLYEENHTFQKPVQVADLLVKRPEVVEETVSNLQPIVVAEPEEVEHPETEVHTFKLLPHFDRDSVFNQAPLQAAVVTSGSSIIPQAHQSPKFEFKTIPAVDVRNKVDEPQQGNRRRVVVRRKKLQRQRGGAVNSVVDHDIQFLSPRQGKLLGVDPNGDNGDLGEFFKGDYGERIMGEVAKLPLDDKSRAGSKFDSYGRPLLL